MIKLRKYITVLLCFCMTMYTLPGYATNTAVALVDDVSVVVLSNIEMSKIMGASGNVDVNLVDYQNVSGSPEQAKAVFVNRSTLYCSYTLNATHNTGNVEVLESGLIAPGEAIVAKGVPEVATFNVSARIWNVGVPGLESRDFSWAY